jgi:hypothetical protein
MEALNWSRPVSLLTFEIPFGPLGGKAPFGPPDLPPPSVSAPSVRDRVLPTQHASTSLPVQSGHTQKNNNIMRTDAPGPSVWSSSSKSFPPCVSSPSSHYPFALFYNTPGLRVLCLTNVALILSTIHKSLSSERRCETVASIQRKVQR